ncbi:MAG: hypothetical protein SGI77_06460 [Pirellulaceae bacterium]|nr:hypothetical protein [Pirellulaceae bacterium]
MMSFVRRVCSLLTFCLGLFGVALGERLASASDLEPATDFEFRRVFVPEADLPLLGSDFVPIEIGEIERLVKSLRQQSKIPVDQTMPRLTQSRYVASLVGQDLVSKASRHSISFQGDHSSYYSFVPCSLAVRPLGMELQQMKPSSRSGFINDSQSMRYDLRGVPSVSVNQSTDFWFGWSAHGDAEQDTLRLRYHLDIPKCLNNRMLLQLPPMWRIESELCVTRPVKNLAEQIEVDWPGLGDLDRESNNWWSIELSNLNSVSFDLVQDFEAFQLKHESLIYRERVDYRLRSSGLEMTSDFHFAETIVPSTKLSIRVAAGLHIAAISLDDRALEWRPSPRANCIDIVSNHEGDTLEAIDGSRMIVRAISIWPLPNQQTKLPTIQVEGAYSLEGVGSLSIQSGWEAHQVSLEGGQVVARSGANKLGGLSRWDFAWAGEPPKIDLQASPRESLGVAETFTHLTNENNGFAATSWLTINASTNPRSAIRFLLSPGWTIESVQSTDRRYMPTVQKSPSSVASEWEILLSPPVANQELELEVRARYSSPTTSENSNTANLTFDGARPITFQDIQQTDFYRIEPVGRYRVDANVGLIQSRIDENQLSERQRDHLPRMGDVWLLKTESGAIPRLSFRRQSAPYSVELETDIVPGINCISATYRLRCKPIAGVVSSVTIDFSRLGNTSIRWRQKTNSSDLRNPWSAVESQSQRRNSTDATKIPSNSTSGDRMVRIELRNATSEAFEIEGYAEFHWARTESSSPVALQIPLPSLPEAAQQDATLHIDNRLALMPWNEDSPWIPTGYTRLAMNNEAHQFRYDPIRVGSVDVRTSHHPDQSKAWLSDVITKYQLFLDGQREIQIDAALHSNDETELMIHLPAQWRFRAASLDGNPVTTSIDPMLSDTLRVWIPRQVSAIPFVPFSLVLDGPPIAIQHRENLELPSIRPDCPITRHRYELWMPASLSVASIDKSNWTDGPTFRLANLWPVDVCRSLISNHLPVEAKELPFEKSPPNQVKSEAPIPRLAWKTEVVKESNSNPMTVLLIVNEFRRAEYWILCFAGLAFSLCLRAIRKNNLAIGLLILLFGMLATSGNRLEALQLVSLGWLLGFVLIAIFACIRPKAALLEPSNFLSKRLSLSANFSRRSGLNPKAPTAPKTATHLPIFWFGLAIVSAVCGECRSSIAQSKPDEIYPIVIPTDSNDEVSSDVGYISEKLLQRLYREQAPQTRAAELISARYELRLVDSDFRGSSSNAILKLRYEIDVQDLSQPITWPLDAKQASFVSLRIDGSETPLGSRLRWNDRELSWTPIEQGLNQVELTIAPIIVRQPDGQSLLAVNVMPIAGALLDIEAGERADVQTNALGQVANPTMGRYQAALGPNPILSVSWREPEKENRTTLPLASIQTSLALLEDKVLAQTKIDIDVAVTKAVHFDIESDAAWQPLGRNWGAAKLLDSVPASSNNRRRYRMHWEKDTGDAGNTRSILIHWISSNPKSALMNLPNVEMPGVRINSNMLRYVRNKESRWNLEGLQSWPLESEEPKARLEWMPQAGTHLLTYRKPLNGSSVFLRRSVGEAKIAAKMETYLRFQKSKLSGRTTISPEINDIRYPVASFLIPAGVHIQSSQVNQVDVPFSTSKFNEEQQRLQVFLDPALPRTDSIEIEFEQNYQESEWNILPFPVSENFEIVQHHASATRVVNLNIVWDAFDTPALNATTTLAPRVPNRSIHINQELEVEAWHTILVPPSLTKPPIEAQETTENHSPPRYRIDRWTHAFQGNAVSRLHRTEDRWRFQVHGQVKASSMPIDGVLMEIPQSILDNLVCSHRIASFASPEIGRQLIFIFSDQSLPNEIFDFEISSNLQATESNSTTSLPEIRLMGDIEWRQWMIVPRSIASQEARWNLSGARTVESSSVPDFIKPEVKELLDDSLVAVPTLDRPSIRLSNVAANRLQITLSLVEHRAVVDANKVERLSSSFSFIPRGHKNIKIVQPANLHLLAAECNGRSIPTGLIRESNVNAQPSEAKETVLNLRLLSSSMPQQVTLHYYRAATHDETDVRHQIWPEAINATPHKSLLVVDATSKVRLDTMRSVDEQERLEIIGAGMLELMEQSTDIVAEAPSNERSQWWRDWESVNTKFWHDASTLTNSTLLESLSNRRQILRERLQLPLPIDASESLLGSDDPFAKENQVIDRLDRIRSTTHSRQCFLMNSIEEPTSNKFPRWATDETDRPSNIKLWLRWSIWFMAAVLTIRFVNFRFERWSVAIKTVLQSRPWWLIVGLGVLSYAIAPTLWLSPCIIAIGLYFAIRAFWNEITRVHR